MRTDTATAGSVSPELTLLPDTFIRLMPPDGIKIREGYADVGDVTLHYVEAGEGPLVVLLHGFPEFWFGWRRQIAPLAAAGFPGIAKKKKYQDFRNWFGLCRPCCS